MKKQLTLILLAFFLSLAANANVWQDAVMGVNYEFNSMIADPLAINYHQPFEHSYSAQQQISSDNVDFNNNVAEIAAPTESSEPLPYALLSNDNTTLTFYYDKNKNYHNDGIVYTEFRTGYPHGAYSVGSYGGWSEHASDITTVIFDSSFANYNGLTTTAYWFEYCDKLSEIIGLNNLNTSYVTDMRWMFFRCSSLTNLDLSSFNTANVKYMTAMFTQCTKLSSLDLSSFDTSNVVDMLLLFSGCSQLATITVSSGWNTDNVTSSDSQGLFDNCTSLIGGLGTVYDANHVDKEYAHVDGGSSNPGYLTLKTSVTPDVENKEAYAALSNDNTTLTFYYDNQKSSRNGMGIGPFTNMKERGWHDYRHHISTVIFDDSFANNYELTSTGYWFDSCRELNAIIGIENLKTDNVTNMSEMFYGCKSLTTLDVSHFNTNNVTSMFGLFAECESLTSIDVRGFNTEKVTNMAVMFGGCENLSNLNLSNFDTSNVTEMEAMFANCPFTTLDLHSFNTEKVTDMSSMFEDASLTTMDISNFNTSNVTDMRYMFHSCKSLTTIYVSGLWNTDKVTKSKDMFLRDSNLIGGNGTVYDENYIDHTYAHIDGGPSNPGYLTLKNGDIPNVENKEAYAALSNDNTTLTFYYDNQKSSRNGMGIGPFGNGEERSWNNYAKKITSVVFDTSFANMTELTSTAQWFRKFENLTTITGIENLKTSKVTDMNQMFGGCMSLSSLDLGSIDTRNVENMTCMFVECRSLTSLNLKNFDTRNVKDMTCMFCECHALETIDLSSFNTEKVKSMYAMFEVCKALKSVNLSSFNTSNVTDMRKMFSQCFAIKVLDLSSFSTSNVTNMQSMFSENSLLTTIYVSDKWSTAKVEKGGDMFDGCTNLVGGSGTIWDSNHTDHTYAHIDGGPSNPGYLTLKGGSTPVEDDEEEETGWYTLIGKKMLLNGSPRGEYMLLQADGYLVWNNKADGNLTIKAHIDAEDSFTLRFDEKPNNFQKIISMENNTVKILAENGLNRTFTVQTYEEPVISPNGTFTAKTTEGVDMLFQIISETEKTCQVGNSYQAAINQNTAGVVTIPSEAGGYTVTKIANRAFKECTKLTQVIIPNTITDIGTTDFESAMGPFHYCIGITSFNIPNSVKTIGRGAFGHCRKITTFKMPESVTILGSNAFDGCTNLETIELSPFITSIQLETFRDCSSLTTIEIPSSVGSFGYNAFQRCNSLRTIYTNIEDPFSFSTSAFTSYAATLYVPTGTKEKYMKTSAWNSFAAIEEFDADGSAYTFTTSKGLTYTVIGKTSTVSVKAASTGLTGEVVIPETVLNSGKRYTVVSIKSDGFAGCASIEKLTIAKTVNNIGKGAFIGCTSLTAFDVTSGSNYETIDGVLYAEHQTRLVAFPAGRRGEFELPKSVTKLADGAFAGCSGLTSLVATQTEPILLTADGGVFDGMDFTNCELHVPLGTASKYRYAEGWKLFQKVVDDSEIDVNGMIYSVNDDGSVALSGADDILTTGDYTLPTEVVVGGVTYPITGIAEHAFEGCTGMVSLTIPESITSIGDHAFSGCTGLEEIYCYSSVPIDLDKMFARRYLCVRRYTQGATPTQFEGVDVENCILYVPCGSSEYYRNASGWSLFKNIVEMHDENDPAVKIVANNLTKEYGDENPEFSFSYAGVRPDGEPAFECEATTASTVGTYNIVIKKGNVKNMNDSYVNGTLTITKAPLTVSVMDAERPQGEENPQFTIVYNGWKLQDTESVLIKKPVGTTTAQKDSPAGEYDIMVSGGEALNYSFNYQNGKLTITAPVGISEVAHRKAFDVYTTEGNMMRHQVTTLKGLPKGVYIVDGNKIVVK